MKFGVCYYPEHWPESRWLIDVQLMREAGIDIVRIGEFAWSKMEPQEDVYDWEWLDRAIDVLGRAGLQVVLGTPTATPPVWLSRAHPDILRVDADELQRDHGTRRHYCPNSTTYRAYSRRIVRAMAERYGTHPHVIGWQIDNEFGGGKTARCYCPNCVAAFSAWLDARYKSIETLNEAWGAVFWSQSYAGFDEIRPPHAGVNYKNPSQVLDFYRFSAESYVTYQQEQIDILRDLAPNHFITHNFMGLYRDLDQHALAKALDFATWDAYPTGFPERWRNFLYAPDADFSRNDPVYAYDVGEPVMINMAHALTRGLKQQPFWIMEQQCGHINWAGLNPQARRGTVRLWTWQSVAAGADVIVFFRWRSTLFAHEQYHSGLLRHDGSTDVGYADLLAMQAERRLLDVVTSEPHSAEIALLFDWDDLWALELQPHRTGFDLMRHLFVYYRALERMGVPVDLVSYRNDLSRYKMLIAPTLHVADALKIAAVTDAVEQGATLLLGVRSGFKTPSNLVTDQPLPGALSDLAGVMIVTWESLPPGVEWAVTSPIAGLSGAASYWMERIRPKNDTEILATYLDLPKPDNAALTCRSLGAGSVLYLGWYPTHEQATSLLQALMHEKGIRPIAELPEGVHVSRRGQQLILLNFTDSNHTVKVGKDQIVIAPRDVRVISAPV